MVNFLDTNNGLETSVLNKPDTVLKLIELNQLMKLKTILHFSMHEQVDSIIHCFKKNQINVPFIDKTELFSSSIVMYYSDLFVENKQLNKINWVFDIIMVLAILVQFGGALYLIVLTEEKK